MPDRKKRVEWPEGSGRYIVPDHVTDVTIEEVKNVVRLSNTRQLKKYFQFAQKTKRTFTLWVRRDTRITKELQDLIETHQILRKDIL